MESRVQILSHNVSLPVVFLVVVLLLGFVRLLRVGRRDKRLPPGPPTLPIIGNLHQIPITGMYKKFKEWGDQYGGVFSLKMGPATTIVLYDRKAVHDLLDKKGAIYSERHFDYVASLVTGGDSFAFMHNTPLWRSQRKVASHNLSPRMLDENIQPLQEAEVGILLSDLVHSPADFYHHIQRTTASVANIFVWGHRGVTYEDFWGSCVYKALDMYSTVLEPGANPPVDQFPFLKYLPDSISPWKRKAKQSYQAMDSTWSSARALVDARRAKGDTKRNSIIDRILNGEKALDITLTDKQLNHFLGVLVEGGAETTAASILTSILQLVQFPEFQKKAQKEIDAVCGTSRSPLWSDFNDLPYVNCIVKEGMRWHPVIPLGVPHRVNQDDWYNGMLIPKDSTIMIPVWAMHFSQKHGYIDPEKYNPDRFLEFPRLASEYAGVADYNQRDHYGYGAGRRICPGMHLAERTQWRITAKILWAFDIVRAVDPDTGKPFPIDPEAYNEGLNHCPKPFKATFRPRSKAHMETIAAEAAKAREFLREYE